MKNIAFALTKTTSEIQSIEPKYIRCKLKDGTTVLVPVVLMSSDELPDKSISAYFDIEQ